MQKLGDVLLVGACALLVGLLGRGPSASTSGCKTHWTLDECLEIDVRSAQWIRSETKARVSVASLEEFVDAVDTSIKDGTDLAATSSGYFFDPPRFEEDSDGRLKITVQPRVKVVVQLPEWAQASSQPSECRDTYMKMMDVLKKHEDEHVKVIESHVDEWVSDLKHLLGDRARLEAMTSAQQRTDWKAEHFKSISATWDKKVLDESKRLDDSTDHGRKGHSWEVPDACKKK